MVEALTGALRVESESSPASDTPETAAAFKAPRLKLRACEADIRAGCVQLLELMR
jgi:hypothetical protein